MTVLVSVLSEAYEYRYLTAFRNGLFDKAIQSYRYKTHSQAHAPQPNVPSYYPEEMTEEEIREALDKIKQEMESLPPKIISQARDFYGRLEYVLTHHFQERQRPGLQKVLDELVAEEVMREELQKEALQDGKARRTFFIVSFERTLKTMAEHAEQISKLMDGRNSLEKRLIDVQDVNVLEGEESEDV
jgi:potassium channel subfamily K